MISRNVVIVSAFIALHKLYLNKLFVLPKKWIFCGFSKTFVGAHFDIVDAKKPTKRWETTPLHSTYGWLLFNTQIARISLVGRALNFRWIPVIPWSEIFAFSNNFTIASILPIVWKLGIYKGISPLHVVLFWRSRTFHIMRGRWSIYYENNHHAFQNSAKDCSIKGNLTNVKGEENGEKRNRCWENSVSSHYSFIGRITCKRSKLCCIYRSSRHTEEKFTQRS